MKHSQSPSILNSIVYGVPLIVTTTVFVVSSALASSQFSIEDAVEIDAIQTFQIGLEISGSLSTAMTLQGDESRAGNHITLQSIRTIKDLDIFGSELMTRSELAKFRRDLKQIQTQGQLEQYLETHRMRMNARAAKRGVVLD